MEIGMFVPLLALPLFLAWVVWNKRRLKQSMAENSDKNVGAVAERMGLTVAQGDPNLNLLYFMQPSGDFERVISMRGRPYGREVEFWVVDGQKSNEYIVARKITTTFGSRLELHVPNAPVFEVVLRNPNQYLVVGQEYQNLAALREVSTGVPALDAQFIVRAERPEVGPALVGALTLLASHQYVHMVGGSQKVWMKVERMGLPYVAASAPEFLLALETAACGVEGRPAPAQAPLPRSAVA